MPEKVRPEPFPVMAKLAVVVAAESIAAPAKRLVDEAVVEKKFVVVAEVPVAFTKVKFWRVVEPVINRLVKVPRPVEVKLPPEPVVKKRFVELAVVEKKLVVVAEVPVAEVKVKLVKEPVGPLTVALVRVELVKVPPSVRRAIDEERPEESESDWRVILGLVSARRISCRKIGALIVGEM